MAVQLTDAQTRVLNRTLDFARSGNQEHFLVSGLAGTGKTTTLIQTVAGLKDMGLRVAVCTPTGKAAHVINSKGEGLFLATTLHKILTARPFDFSEKLHKRLDALDMESQKRELTAEEKREEQELYKQIDQAEKGGSLSFEPACPDKIRDEYDILIFDESSMIGKKHTFDPLIAPVRLKKIFYGDKAQLPPVKDSYGVDLAHADCHLEEILRQGSDSGIIPYAHMIHKHGRFMADTERQGFTDVRVVRSINPSALKGFEDHQIIVWSNRERHQINPIIRKARGFDTTGKPKPYLPLPGESVMVDQNHEGYRLLKGQMLKVTDVDADLSFNPYLCTLFCVDDRQNERVVQVSLTDCVTEALVDTSRHEWADEKARREANRAGLTVMWPYALTCHKSQGSEFEKVFVFGSMSQTNPDWRRWMYTAVTRARKELVMASLFA